MTQPFDTQNQPPPMPQGQAISYQSMGASPRRRHLGFGWTFLIGFAAYFLVVGVWLIGNPSGVLLRPYFGLAALALYVILIVIATFLRWWGFIAAMLIMIPLSFLLIVGMCFYAFSQWNSPPPPPPPSSYVAPASPPTPSKR